MSRRTETTSLTLPSHIHSLRHWYSPPWKHVTVNEHIHHYHSAFTAYMRVHPWCFLSVDSDKCMPDTYHIMRGIFTALKIFCVLSIPSSTTNLWQAVTFCCLHHFAFSRMSHNRYQIVWSLFRLASLTQNMHFRFLHCFSWLDCSPLFRAE